MLNTPHLTPFCKMWESCGQIVSNTALDYLTYQNFNACEKDSESEKKNSTLQVIPRRK
jgi:hypothetical protein